MPKSMDVGSPRLAIHRGATAWEHGFHFRHGMRDVLVKSAEPDGAQKRDGRNPSPSTADQQRSWFFE